jgi:long-chain fatty acid transport protein
LSDDWLLRTGYANDQSPVSNSYRINQDLDIDFAFSYLFFEDTQVNEYDRDLEGNQKGAANLQGDYSMDATAYSFQVNYTI